MINGLSGVKMKPPTDVISRILLVAGYDTIYILAFLEVLQGWYRGKIFCYDNWMIIEIDLKYLEYICEAHSGIVFMRRSVWYRVL